MKKDYIVKVAGFFYGSFYPVGKVLKLHPKQAYYEVLLGNLAPHVPTAAATQAETPKMTQAQPASRGRRRITETASSR